jgi:hypothetical protein
MLKGVAKMPKTKKPLTKGKLSKKLDEAWSLAVKKKAGYKCEVCGIGESGHLNSHHIVGRRNRMVRWDIRDGVCLCVKHHRFGIESAHEDPLWFREWLEENRWEDYAYLYTVKNQIKKWTLEDMEKQLEDLNKIIKGK